jgi:hypothetical protein
MASPPPVAVAAPPPPESQARMLASPTFATGSLALASVPEPQLDEDLPRAELPEPTPVPTSAVAETPRAHTEPPEIATWRAILARIKPTQPAIAATLELAAPQLVTRDRIVLGFEPESFENSRASESEAKSVLAEAAKAVFSSAALPAVTFDVAARGSKGASVASLDAAKRKAAVLEARSLVEKHPLVQKALAIFDAELKDIRLPAQEE